MCEFYIGFITDDEWKNAAYPVTAYPVAVFLMGKSAAGLAFYAYVIPFLVSTAGGAVISGVLIYSLKKANILAGMQEAMGQ